MTARERFQLGQTVQLTRYAIERKVKVYAGKGKHRVATGVVSGFGRDPDIVRVLPTGAKCIQSYYMEFWQPVPVPKVLKCPQCGAQHIDEGEWATRPHRTHQCQFCKHEWRPFEFHTVGVKP